MTLLYLYDSFRHLPPYTRPRHLEHAATQKFNKASQSIRVAQYAHPLSS